MEKQDKIYIAGHSGLLGKHLVCQLAKKGYENIVIRNSSELDLTQRDMVRVFFEMEKPDYVFLVAAKTGGVAVQKENPVDFFCVNMQIEMNILECARIYKVKKLVFVGASCVYPESMQTKKAVAEEMFQTGWVQKGTEAYGLAKAAGLKLCEFYNQQYNTNFVTALPVNLYGRVEKPEEMTNVLPNLCVRIKKAVESNQEEVTIWGDGTTMREFLHVIDCADALIKIMESKINTGWINIGTGSMVSINELAKLIAENLGYKGEIRHDLTKPGGSKRSLLDISKLRALGWEAKISLQDGIKDFIESLS